MSGYGIKEILINKGISLKEINENQNHLIEKYAELLGTKVCPICNTEFPFTDCKRIYCSNLCSAKAIHQAEQKKSEILKILRRASAVNKICPVCKIEFFPNQNQKYCSKECRGINVYLERKYEDKKPRNNYYKIGKEALKAKQNQNSQEGENLK